MAAIDVKPQLLPSWVTARRLLTIYQVAEVTGYSVYEVREFRKRGLIHAVLDKKPYKFDPLHIYQVFFCGDGPSVVQVSPQVRSLKTEEANQHSHKPVTEDDLWL